MKRILFIDDERFFASRYVELLEQTFEVQFADEVDEALKALRSDTKYAVAIVDVVMPPPRGFEAETMYGMSTGIWLLQQARKEIEKRNLPIIVFTNRGSARVAEECALIGLPPELLTVSSKMAVSARQLPMLVESAISRAERHES